MARYGLEDFDADQIDDRPIAVVLSLSRSRMLNMRILLAGLVALFIATRPGWGQEAQTASDVQKGRQLAILICANCHVAASSQPFEPILQPPASSFESIAQCESISADWVQTFLATTHRGLDNPRGMPNPELLESQIKQVAAYLLSLRKNP